MKNTYIAGLVVVLVVAVGLFFGMKKEKLEAPMEENNNSATGTFETGKIEVNDADVSTNVGESTPLPVNNTTGVSVTSEPVKEFTVSGKNFSFSPNKITVKKGDKVKITFQNSEGFHDWKIDEFGVATKQTKAPTSEVLEFTADKVGSFEYYCSVGSHRAMGMKGTLVVE